MPQTKPSNLNVSEKLDSNSFRRDLLRQLNYIINDLYSWLDKARGLGDKTLDSISTHDHTSDAQGGDYPWADMTASQLAYLVLLQATISVANLLDKSASETISGEYTFGVFPITPSAAPDANYEVANKKYVDDSVLITSYGPSSITATAGGVTGTVAGVQTAFDSSILEIAEVAATPGFDIRFNFTDIEILPNRIVYRLRYAGSASHAYAFELYNYITDAWDRFSHRSDDVFNEYVWAEMAIPNPANYRDGSNAMMSRLYHFSGGVSSHDIYIDLVALRT